VDEGDDLDSSVLGQVVLLADIAAVQNLPSKGGLAPR
jgi:hypothetical protein